MELCEYELINDNIVFVDGLTRVGKSMLNILLASLDGVSHPQVLEPLEQLMPMYKTGHMDKNSISAFLRLHLNEKFYNYMLSRNLNFRYDDLTSIHNSSNEIKFYKNLSKIDGETIINELRSDTTLHQFQTHDVLTQYSLFLDLNIEAKIIEIFRNPIDTIHSWYKRGWGKRFDNEDPRSFTSLFKYEGKTLPHYAIGYENIYFSLNEMEKCVFLHNKLLNESLVEYNKLSSEQKYNILILKYEDILEKPDIEIDKICLFLNVNKTEHTSRFMKHARVPRELKLDDRKNKTEEIRRNINIKLFDELMYLSNQYKSSLYDLDL